MNCALARRLWAWTSNVQESFEKFSGCGALYRRHSYEDRSCVAIARARRICRGRYRIPRPIRGRHVGRRAGEIESAAQSHSARRADFRVGRADLEHWLRENRHARVRTKCEPAVRGGAADIAAVSLVEIAPAFRHDRLHGPGWQAAGASVPRGQKGCPNRIDDARGAQRRRVEYQDEEARKTGR
jgi:hypothetical protein